MAVIGCFRRIVTLAVLVVVAGVAWLERDRLVALWRQVGGTSAAHVEVEAPTEALAERAQAKLAELAEGREVRVALSEAELQSLLRYRYEQLLPGFIDSARVELDGDRLWLHVRLPSERLPRVDRLGEAAALLPDTANVAVRGQLLPLDSGRIAFAIDEVTAAGIPLPRRIVPSALERLGRRDERGLAADAVALPLPPGTGAAYVRRDSLVLLARSSSISPRN